MMWRSRLTGLVSLPMCLLVLGCDSPVAVDYTTTVEGTVTVEGERSYASSGLDLRVWLTGPGTVPNDDGQYFLDEFTSKDDCGTQGLVFIGIVTQDPIQSKPITYCEYNEVDFHIVPPAGPSG